MIEISIILILILLNALFVASEFATVSAPRTAIEKRAGEGDKAAEMVLSVLKEPLLQDRYIAASQVGITAASLGLGMYGEHVIANWLVDFIHATTFVEVASSHAIASALALLALTYLHIVLGEMVPKSLALQRSETVMLILAGPMRFFMKAFYPVIYVLNTVNNFLLKRLLGIDRARATIPAYTPDEIQFIVKQSETEGIISDEIGMVVEQMFDFKELVAEDVMVPRVYMIALPMRPEIPKLKDLMKQRAHARYPVYGVDKDDIVGVVHIKDLARLMESTSPRSMPIRPLPYVPLNASLQTVLEAMSQLSTHIAIVLDEHGGTAGMITMQDIFEEVIGEIDESLSQASIYSIGEGVFEVEGTVRLDELADHLDIRVEEDDVTTISGLILDQLNRPPAVGDKFDYGRLSIEVTRIRGRGVRLCIVRKIEPPPETELDL